MNIFADKEQKYSFKRYLLKDIANIKKGFTPSTRNELYWNNGEYNWLSIADISQKYIYNSKKKITKLAIENKEIIPKNTLIMSFKLTIGKLGILKRDMFTNEAICNFNWKNKYILTEYMYYYLKTINLLKYGSQAAKGITLNNETLNSIPVYIPNTKNQQKIIDILNSFNGKISLIQDKIKQLSDFKDNLLQKMFI